MTRAQKQLKRDRVSLVASCERLERATNQMSKLVAIDEIERAVLRTTKLRVEEREAKTRERFAALVSDLVKNKTQVWLSGIDFAIQAHSDSLTEAEKAAFPVIPNEVRTRLAKLV